MEFARVGESGPATPPDTNLDPPPGDPDPDDPDPGVPDPEDTDPEDD
jgi:hypothetical protein